MNGILDHEIDKYPPHLVGGNGKHIYVDVETVRVPEAEMAGAENLLTDAWERYYIPLSVTEVHLGCTREEQLRWFYQAYQTGQRLVDKGVDFRAITAWAILGSYNWNSLLTVDTDYYEPGLFDVRSREPRPTALADLVADLIRRETHFNPVITEPGWWQRETHTLGVPPTGKKPLLVFTDEKPLGEAFSLICEVRGLACRIVSTDALETMDALDALTRYWQPWGIITIFKQHAWLLPHHGLYDNQQLRDLTHLLEVCQRKNIPLLTFSDGSVFDGTKGMPYTESDLVCPQRGMGENQAKAEKLIRETLEQSLIVRTGMLLNPWHTDNFITRNLQKFSRSEPLDLPANQRISPAYLPEVIHHSLDLLLDKAYGIWHLANVGEVSWAEFARKLAHQAGIERTGVEDWYRMQQEKSLRQPAFSTALTSDKAILMSDLDEAIANYCQVLPKHVLA